MEVAFELWNEQGRQALSRVHREFPPLSGEAVSVYKPVPDGVYGFLSVNLGGTTDFEVRPKQSLLAADFLFLQIPAGSAAGIRQRKSVSGGPTPVI